MTDRRSPFTLAEIGSHNVRFSSTGIFETHKDQMIDPYAATKIPKEAQVEGTHYAPQAKGTFPSIVLLHDSWGLTTQIKDTAQQLACEGFVVLVPNLYGRQGGMITANAEVAEALMERLNEQHALQDINACCEYLNANLSEDTTLEQTKRNIHAVVGYGMGGTLAIRFACQRKRLRAAVAFYGKLSDVEETAKNLYCPVLYHAAGSNGAVSQDLLDQFQASAKQEGKQVDIQQYPDASAGFCNTMQPNTYQAESAERAWRSTIDFINQSIQSP